jgi:hypothetical protein
MSLRDPFLASVIARSSIHSLIWVGIVIAGLWLAILWAVSLP